MTTNDGKISSHHGHTAPHDDMSIRDVMTIANSIDFHHLSDFLCFLHLALHSRCDSYSSSATSLLI